MAGTYSRWECQSPADKHGGGYAYVKLRFPCCLWDYPGVYQKLIHAHWHVRGSKATRRLLRRLLRWGLAYAAFDGAISEWQWRFWRGSPLREQMKGWTKQEQEGSWDSET